MIQASGSIPSGFFIPCQSSRELLEPWKSGVADGTRMRNLLHQAWCGPGSGLDVPGSWGNSLPPSVLTDLMNLHFPHWSQRKSCSLPKCTTDPPMSLLFPVPNRGRDPPTPLTLSYHEPPIHTHTHTQTYTHTHTPTNTQTHTGTNTRTHTNTRKPTHTHSHSSHHTLSTHTHTHIPYLCSISS